jgi:PAS domain S-box-containing protein
MDSKLLELEKKLEESKKEVSKLTNILNIICSNNTENAQKAIEEYKNNTINKLTPEIKIQDKKTYHFFKIIIESMPFPVFIKDENGRYLLINALELKLFGLKETEVLGKDDSHFLKDKEELDLVLNTDQEVLNGKKEVELPSQRFTLPNGTQYVFKTHKMLFINPVTKQPNILGFSIDVTDTVNLNRLKEILVMTSNPYL